MSRFLRKPIQLPEQVQVSCTGQQVEVSGAKGQLGFTLPEQLEIQVEGRELWLRVAAGSTTMPRVMAGTAYAILRNLVRGVSQGFERRLNVVGVGYRAQVQDRVLNLALGFSHPVAMDIPAGLEVETPAPTEIIVRGTDRQAVGSLAARIRALRPPEPYKGKGVLYAGEQIRRKETKRKA